MPFGTVSAVAAWHRLGSLLCEAVRRRGLCPCGRYVVHFYGSSWDLLTYISSELLNIVASLVGTILEPKKCVAMLLDMAHLGAQIVIDRAR